MFALAAESPSPRFGYSSPSSLPDEKRSVDDHANMIDKVWGDHQVAP